MNGQPSGVAAVVVTHNSAATLRRCLESLLTQPALSELVLVDNGSQDQWRPLLPADARVHCIANEDNPGFAVACNQGAGLCHSPWLLFINPDCFVESDTLQRLLEQARQVPSLGALGAELVDLAGRVDPASRRRAPTPAALFGRAAAVAPSGAEASARAPLPEPVEAISGALMLMPRSAFEQVGGFDAGYRLHCEDLDLCRRLRAAGLSVAVASGVRVVHLKGGSSQTRPLWVEWQKHRGMLRYFRTFDAASAPWWLRLAVPIGIALRYPLAAARAWWRARRRDHTGRQQRP